MDTVRNGELEATNYFYSLGDQENVLELTFNHDGRTYELGSGYGHITIAVDDLDGTLERLKEQGSNRSGSRTACARAARDCASSEIRIDHC
jgi:Glyoxalase/Bleomycin resistance protein/Dioxygenase superfamily